MTSLSLNKYNEKKTGQMNTELRVRENVGFMAISNLFIFLLYILAFIFFGLFLCFKYYRCPPFPPHPTH